MNETKPTKTRFSHFLCIFDCLFVMGGRGKRPCLGAISENLHSQNLPAVQLGKDAVINLSKGGGEVLMGGEGGEDLVWALFGKFSLPAVLGQTL